MIINSSTSKYTLSTVVTESKITTTIVKTTQTSQIEGRCWNIDGVPSDLVLTVDSYEQISGEFVINSTNHIGHKVYISDDNITFTLLTTLTGSQNSFVAAGLTPDTIYYFKVVAYKVDIISPFELTENAQTEAVQPITINSITVVWNNINDEFDITVDATGGTGVYTVTYTQNLNILNVVVTDTIGTTANQNVNLDDISPIVIDSATYEVIDNVAHVTIVASGGFGDLTYQLGVQTNSTGIFTVSEADTYAIEVSDDGGATPATSSILIELFPFASDLTLWAKQRDGLIMEDSISGNDVVIEMPYIYLDGTGDSLFCADNKALDIINSIGTDINGVQGFTFCGFMKSLDNKSLTKYFAGKHINTSKNGRYGIYSDITTGFITGFCQSSGGAVTVTSNIDATTKGWFFYLIDINLTTNKFRLFIDNVQVGTDQNIVGTFAETGNEYEFRFGTGNSATGTSTAIPGLSAHSESWIFPRLLTLEERTTLFNKGYVNGAKAHWVFGKTDSNYIYDVSGNNFHLQGVTLAYTNFRYGIEGSRYPLDKGYSLYKKSGEPDNIVPFLESGAAQATPPMVAGYNKIKDVSGNQLYHNLTDSYLYIIGNNWDRSNTIIYADAARNTTPKIGKYLASNPNYWHVDELNKLLMYEQYLNAGYKGLTFPKLNENSIYTRNYIEEILTYSNNKTLNDLKSVLKYTNDDNIIHDISYTFKTDNWCATRGLKVLAFDNVDTLKLSLDGGVTFNISKQLNSFGGIVCFAHIFLNGNILFCSHTKAYLSTDNLATYNLIDVKDINGNSYLPVNLNSFTSTGYNFASIDGTEILVWGNYSTDVGTQYANINCFYSIDNGVTVKSAYHFGTTSPVLSARHIHSVNFNQDDNSFWIQTGDGTDECHWIRGTYNINTDQWTWVKIAGDNEDYSSLFENNTYYKTTGMIFKDGYVYWGSDSNDSAKDGIWRAPLNDIANQLTYEKVYTSSNKVVSLGGNSSELIASVIGGKYIVTSIDFVTYKLHELTGGPDLNISSAAYYKIIDKNANDEYVIGIIDSTETLSNWMGKDVLIVKIIGY